MVSFSISWSKLYSIYLGICFFLFSPVIATSLNPFSIVRLPFGDGQAYLGGDFREGESWYPVFFAITSDGSIHVPDFYKNRIAVFNSAGGYERSIPVADGISPRMAYFAVVSDGRYLSYDNYDLWRIDADGKASRIFGFPFGSIPSGIVRTDAGLFISMPASGGGDVSYRLADGPHADYDFSAAPLSLPESLDADPAIAAGGFSLVAVHPGGKRVWFDGSDRVIVARPEDSETRPILLEGLPSARAFSWIHATEAGTVAVARFSEGALTIATYRIEE